MEEFPLSGTMMTAIRFRQTSGTPLEGGAANPANIDRASKAAELDSTAVRLHQAARESPKSRLKRLLAVQADLPVLAIFAPFAAWRETCLSLAKS